MNSLVRIESTRSLTASDVRDQVNLVQSVMQAVMKKDTHYGIIPGCKQPSLFKAGSEVLLSTFRIAVSVLVEDLSTPDSIRYRVRTVGTHQGTQIVVGEGIGECSSDEEKYKWRRCSNKKEFDATPENRRRIKFSKFGEDMQVRTEPADMANTVLKMAKKRAQIDLTLTATAASDIFTQDVEDMPDEIREQVADEARARARPGTQATERAIPPDSPERDKLIANLLDVADQGAEEFRVHWRDNVSKDQRALVWDKVDTFKARAEAADKAKIINTHDAAADAAAVDPKPEAAANG